MRKLLNWMGFSIVLVAGLAEAPARAQTVRQVTLAAPTVAEVAAMTPRSAAERREFFERKFARISSHHKTVPVQRSNMPFATEIRTDPLKVERRNRQAGFGTGVKIITERSVTGLARLDYDNASPISEPSIAVRGNEILVTGNWYAARSLDAGQTFESIEPLSMFGQPQIGQGFCCDQVTLYDRQTDTMYWLMQGHHAETIGNTRKLLVATGTDDIRSGRFRHYEIPITVIAPNGAWFDFPDMAVSNGHLYITSNIFGLPTAPGGEEWKASTVLRIKKEPLSRYEVPTLQAWTTQEAFTLKLTQGAQARMYWGSHRDDYRIIVRSWDDASSDVSPASTVHVEKWLPTTAATIGASNAKNGQPWLRRSDSRMSAAWLAGDHIGFGWNAGEDQRFPCAHIRIALVDPAAVDQAGDLPIRATAEPHIWAEDKSIAYPAAAANSRGEVGVSIMFAGPNHMPSYAVGVLVQSDRKEVIGPDTATDSNAGPATGTDAWAWGFTIVKSGKNTPVCPPSQPDRCGVWGDYFAVRPHGQSPATWVGVGYTLQNDGANEKMKAEAVYAWFGQKSSRFGDSVAGIATDAEPTAPAAGSPRQSRRAPTKILPIQEARGR